MSAPFLLFLRAIMTLSLYAFMAWAFLLLWRNLKTQGELLAIRKTPPLALTYHDAASNSLTRHFRHPEITLGRDPHCEVYLDNETVSAQHARLSYHHGQWWLEDLNSTNGTTLNGEEVDTATIVISGDEIHCGKAPLQVRFALDELSPNTREISRE
jgi:pSer/pThr/pTyr-binding forkhead associated (FHA) protein